MRLWKCGTDLSMAQVEYFSECSRELLRSRVPRFRGPRGIRENDESLGIRGVLLTGEVNIATSYQELGLAGPIVGLKMAAMIH